MTSSPVICRCQQCNGEIEFDSSRAGETVACPHCAIETTLYIPGGSQRATPPPQEDRPPTLRELQQEKEQVFLREGGVMVSNIRFVVDGQTYAMSGITSVAMTLAPKKQFFPLLWILIGALWCMTAYEMRSTTGLVTGGTFILLSIITLIQRSRDRYRVTICTSAGETNALQSRSKHDILRIVDALNQSILARG